MLKLRLFLNTRIGRLLMVIASQYGAVAIGLFSTTVTARTLGVVGYGRLSLLIALPALSGALLSAKTIDVSTRVFSECVERKDWSGLGQRCAATVLLDLGLGAMAIPITAILVAVASLENTLQSNEILAVILFSLSLMFTSTANSAYAACIATQQFSWLVRLQLVERVAVMISTIVMIYLLGTPISALIGMALGNVFSGAMNLVYLRSTLVKMAPEGNHSMLPTRQVFRELRGQLLWSFGRTSVSSVFEQVPIILLGRSNQFELAGLYRVGLLINSVAGNVESAMTRSLMKEIRDASPKLSSLFRLSFTYGIPAGLAVLGSIPIVAVALPRFLGAEFGAMRGGVLILLSYSAVSALFFWVFPLYVMRDELDIFTCAFAVVVLVYLIAVIQVRERGFEAIAAAMASARLTLLMFLVTRLYVCPRGSVPDSTQVAR